MDVSGRTVRGSRDHDTGAGAGAGHAGRMALVLSLDFDVVSAFVLLLTCHAPFECLLPAQHT